jgi:hypothetical protein
MILSDILAYFMDLGNKKPQSSATKQMTGVISYSLLGHLPVPLQWLQLRPATKNPE